MPLKVHPSNPRYFADETGRAVYLTGFHTHQNLIDAGDAFPPKPFDYNSYLSFLEENHHNFMRMWSPELFCYRNPKNIFFYRNPTIWERTGPGNALDGKPRFDLTKFNQDYFDRMRARILEFNCGI